MTAPDKYSGLDAYVGQDAMTAYMKGLAERLPAGGRAKSALSRRCARGLMGMAARAERGGVYSDNVRWIAVLARQLARERPVWLPAGFSRPRASIIAGELIAHSFFSVSRRSMAMALEAFDSRQGLEMEEIWLFPRQVTIELIEAFYQVALRVEKAKTEEERGLKWASAGADTSHIKTREGAFFDSALKSLGESGREADAGEVKKWLDDRAGASRVLSRARESRSKDEAFLQNIVSSLREVSDMNWKDEYEKLCRAERILLKDEVYSSQDDSSKSAVRRETAIIARKSGLGEWTVARHAANLAKSHSESPLDTLVYWLCDPDGRRALMRELTSREQPSPIDAKALYIICFCAIFLILVIISSRLGGPYTAIALGFLSWRLARRSLDFLIRAALPARHLYKLKFARVPEQYRTLVVIPALLSSAERARKVAEQLETLGAAMRDDCVEYLLLGDFRDSPEENEDDDARIVACAREAVDALNRAEGKKRYHYLHRNRVYVETDAKFMARERKRGALMELNALILGKEASFLADSRDEEFIRGRFKYVLTLDADARMLPDSQRALIGAMAHPLNRRRSENGVKKGFSVICPRVEQRESSRFSSLAAFPGGLDAYPAAASGSYWDMCAACAFCGKGIYDVREFYDSVIGVIPDYAILSHDLLEGALSGAGLASDVVALDDFPRTLAGYLKRLHRWTRGDWQLLPYIFTLPIGAVYRFMMLDNLVTSLLGVMSVIAIAASFWLGLAFPLFYALLSVSWGFLRSPKRALAALALLPATSYTSLDAVIRALYRVYHSRKGLLQWTPAADGEGDGMLSWPGKLCAALILPGLFHGPFAPFAAGLGLVFWAGTSWLCDERPGYVMTLSDKEELLELAKATWRYFETVVPLGSNGLPPDNLQIEPALPPAGRTSPTNISMYMLSCLSAEILGIITKEEARERIEATVSTMERLDKWRGQFYNWYDTETASPLIPKYVSSVDGGNLAAGLMLISARYKGELGRRCENLARGMDLAALYDDEKKLFYIGYDVSSGRMSLSRYDLLASESRILSLAAIALQKVGEEHWFRLGRRMSGKTLLSWSGTAFEYLMPELFTPSYAGTLLYESGRALAEDSRGEIMGVWGVSESGYYAFDSKLNYQYRSFGLAKNALGISSDGKVIAPYATLLALRLSPEKSLRNLRLMKDLGWMGEYGLYEAADCDPERIPKNADYKIIKSYMSHHQGMIITAIANYLTEGSVSRAFTSRADVRAYLPLLEQRPMRSREIGSRERERPSGKAPLRAAGRRAIWAGDCHLMEGGGTTVLATGAGRCLTSRDGFDIDRFSGFFAPNDGTVTTVVVDGEICEWSPGFFSPGEAVWTASRRGVSCALRVMASVGDGAYYRLVEIENTSGEYRNAAVYNAFAVALAKREGYLAHPAFMNMFVKAEMTGENQVAFRRLGRESADCPPAICTVYAPKDARVSLENDLDRLLGRRGGIGCVSAYPEKFVFKPGYPLNPCLCQKIEMKLAPGRAQRAVFSVEFGLSLPASADDMAERAEKAAEIARSRVVAELGFLSMSISRYHVCDAASRYAYCPRAHAASPLREANKNDLWEMGLDVNRPIIAAFVSSKDEIPLAREAAGRYMLYACMGVSCSLALVDDEKTDYARPVLDALNAVAAFCATGDARRGEVRVLSGAGLSAKNRTALRLCAVPAKMADANGKAEASRFAAPTYKFPNLALLNKCAFGGFSANGREYVVNVKSDFPAPWCNVLANERFGAILSERAGGFCWYGNSRLGRITPWTGDPLYEGELFALSLKTGSGGLISLAPLLPPARATHSPGKSVYESKAAGFEWNIDFSVPPGSSFIVARVEIRNVSGRDEDVNILLEGNFLMGADANDARMLSYGFAPGLMTASGAMDGVGFLFMQGAKRHGEGLSREARLLCGEGARFEVILGFAENEQAALERVSAPRESAEEYWDELLSRVALETPDGALNAFVSRWLPYQTVSSRLFARSGFYQSGGAYGFRDQLQDALAVIPLKPSFTRKHILLCASRQFEAGDVLHWWHPPATGVRTRISDDRVFLPYVTAVYALESGDVGILDASAPYLKDAPIEEGRDDLYAAATPSDALGTVHEHCMRAIRLSAATGPNGMALMGGGDWNDGMNRVNGESVWLSEFLAATCDLYASVLGPEKQEDIKKLNEIARKMREAVEERGWDGEWYRRACYPDGEFIGGAGADSCLIDIVSQSWAALAGLDRDRCEKAMDSAWNMLVSDGVIKLLTPPFVQGAGRSPGYIADYPPGVRENGGQYTHAACWAVMAWAKLGQKERAWSAFETLLPYARKACDAKAYRAEPYALAADVYAGDYAPRAGWTWYTGAAAWLYRTALYSLMGLERRGSRARLNALLKSDWNEAAIVIKTGSSRYRLTARRGVKEVTLDGELKPDGWIELKDDGKPHEALFPPRA